MAWLHLKLLAARASFIQVIASASREHKAMAEQEQRIRARLDRGDCDDELKRSLEQQLEVIQSRRAAHADAKRRLELVEAELERLRQQVALVREQALLATDENSAAQSLNAVSASLNEANRWLKDQRELFAGLDLNDEAPPADLLMPKMDSTPKRRRVAE
jgi:chromosome condensin MukBEF ATPase and DNA-binding subunit MukB